MTCETCGDAASCLDCLRMERSAPSGTAVNPEQFGEAAYRTLEEALAAERTESAKALFWYAIHKTLLGKKLNPKFAQAVQGETQRLTDNRNVDGAAFFAAAERATRLVLSEGMKPFVDSQP